MYRICIKEKTPPVFNTSSKSRDRLRLSVYFMSELPSVRTKLCFLPHSGNFNFNSLANSTNVRLTVSRVFFCSVTPFSSSVTQ